MEKKDMINFLKDNLRIEIEESTDYMETKTIFQVKILLKNELLDSDYIEIPQR